MNEKKYDDLDGAEEVIVQNINKMFHLISKERTIRDSGQMCTYDDFELVHELLNSHRNDFAINAMNEAIINIYKESIENSLKLLFSQSYSFDEDGAMIEDNLRCWQINKVMDYTMKEIMNKRLDAYDYF